MPTISLTSHDLVEQIDNDTVRLCRQLRAKDVFPTLAVVAVGETAQSPYITTKQKAARALGIEVSVYRLPVTTTPADAQAVLSFLNEDAGTHGILIQLPLPTDWSESDVEATIKTISAEKDVDGLAYGRPLFDQAVKSIDQLQDVAIAEKRYLPTTALAILQLINAYEVPLKKIVVVGRGRLVGIPLAQLLTVLKAPHSIVDLEAKDRLKQIAQADLVLAGTDSTEAFLNRSSVKEGAAVLAAGAEADHEALHEWASFLSPARGGIGPLTIANLLSQTVRAAAEQQKSHA